MTYLGGLHAALWLLGALTPFLAVAVLYVLAALIDPVHRLRVAKLRRHQRRYGRNPGLDH